MLSLPVSAVLLLLLLLHIQVFWNVSRCVAGQVVSDSDRSECLYCGPLNCVTLNTEAL
jgi:hypothetical protein